MQRSFSFFESGVIPKANRCWLGELNELDVHIGTSIAVMYECNAREQLSGSTQALHLKIYNAPDNMQAPGGEMLQLAKRISEGGVSSGLGFGNGSREVSRQTSLQGDRSLQDTPPASVANFEAEGRREDDSSSERSSGQQDRWRWAQSFALTACF